MALSSPRASQAGQPVYLRSRQGYAGRDVRGTGHKIVWGSEGLAPTRVARAIFLSLGLFVVSDFLQHCHYLIYAGPLFGPNSGFEKREVLTSHEGWK